MLTNSTQRQSFPSLRDIVVDNLAHACTAFMSFADLRDANSAFARAIGLGIEWDVQYIAAAQYLIQDQKVTLSADVIYEGQILIRADVVWNDRPFDVDALGQMIKSVLCRHGDLMALELGIVRREAKNVSFKAEYYHVDAAKKALRVLDGHDLGVRLLSNHEKTS